MKRFLLGSVLFLAVGVGIVLWHFELRPLPATRLAPADAELFVECPNLARTAERWPTTALSHILNEPSVQRFCGYPWHALPEGYQLIWTHLVKLQPTSAFFCSVDASHREWLLGLRCASSLRGWQQDAQGLASNFFGGRFVDLGSKAPAGAGAALPPGDAVVYGIRCGSWLLFSSNPSVARAAFDRRTRARAGLETCEAFERCQAKVKAGPDMITFAQGSVAEMMPLLGCASDPKERRALIAATTLDGTQIRDQVFTLAACDHQGATPPLSRVTLEATSVDTLFYASTRAVPSTWQKMAHAAAGSCGVAETFEQYFGVLANAGIDIRDLDAVLGDLEIVIEREPVTDIVEPVFSLGIRDVPKVQRYLDQLVRYRFSECTSRGEIEQVPVYRLHAGTNARPVTVVFGIVGQQLICAGSPACFAETVRRLRVHQIGLDRSERYRAAAKSVAPATEAFAYLDTKPAFEKIYPTLRPMAILGTAFVPTLAHYVDPFTLPDTGEISRYLTPIVFSRRHLPEGTMDESVGPITAYQAVVFGYGAGLVLGLVQSAAN